MDRNQKKVLVFGSGISGIGACRLLESRGEEVILYDGNENLDREKMKVKLGEDSKAEIILGELEETVMDDLKLVVISPGVPTDLPVVERIREKEIPVWGEIELAYTYGKGDVLAITGTNGKTTTTALLGEIMKSYHSNTYVVGNIGNPYTTVVDDLTDDSIVVAEMSSFQLESILTFRPKVSALLNISPDHLNRHHTMEAYIGAKKAIAKNQSSQDYCILNYEDETAREFGKNVASQVLYFSSQRKLETGVYMEDGNIICNLGEKEEKICHTSELKILGTHNHENVMAAVGMARAYGVPADVIRRAVLAFKGVEHRIEYVCTKNEVSYYNDSKGTNPDAAIKGIQAMKGSTVLIGGGYDKASEYEEWIQSFDGKVEYFVLLGETKEKIADAARKCGFQNIVFADTLEDAVSKAASLAKPGESVLLSPACASWDMFKSYEERGDKFKELVNSL